MQWRLVSTRRLALAGTAFALLVPAATAYAADQSPAGGATSQNSTASSAQEQSLVEEIVVTARKKTERLVDVPVAASVLTTDRINQYVSTDLTSIGNQVPGVSFEHTGGGGAGASLSIRGVGNLAGDYGTEQPVALVLDGVSLTRGHAIDMSMYDLSDVQILKGPQALFFGKNSPAGVVAIDTQNPGQSFSGYLTGQHEFVTNTWATEGAVSLPINDTLAVRLAGRFSDMLGGYYHNDAKPIADVLDPGGLELPGAAYPLGPGTRTTSVRATVDWHPTDAFSAVLKATYNDYWDRGGAVGSEVAACDPGVTHPSSYGVPDPFQTCQDTPMMNRNGSNGEPPLVVAQHFYPGIPDDKPFNHSTTNVDSLTLTYKLPQVTLTSVTGYYNETQSDFDNFDGTVWAQAIDYQKDTDSTVSEELRAASSFNFPVNFTVGAFFESETLDIFNTDKIAPTGAFAGVNFSGQPLYEPIPTAFIGEYNSTAWTAQDHNTTYSVFGQLDWKILSNLDLAGGARWTAEHKTSNLGDVFDIFDYLLGPLNSPFSPGGVRYNPTVNEANVSPEVTLTWHPQHDLTLYGAYKTGYLSGGIQNPGGVPNVIAETGSLVGGVWVRNIAAEDRALEYNPETVSGGEVGVKGIFFNGRVNGDLTFYDYNYTNLQVITFYAPALSFNIHNAGTAVNRGVELNLSGQLTDDLSAHGQIEYSYLAYGTFTSAQCYGGETVAQGCVGGQQNLSGQRYGGPPVSTDLGLNFEHALFGNFKIAIAADWYWYANGFLNGDEANTAAQAYSLVNASVRILEPGKGWEFGIIGTNIFNADPFTGGADVPLGSNGEIGGLAIPPAEVTAEVSYHW